jgi:hypothetical protein
MTIQRNLAAKREREAYSEGRKAAAAASIAPLLAAMEDVAKDLRAAETQTPERAEELRRDARRKLESVLESNGRPLPPL